MCRYQIIRKKYMRFSKLFIQTYKDIPSDATLPSHQLMHRAGFILKSAAGLYNYSPLMLRVIQKSNDIIRQELTKIDCLEISLSLTTPADLWKKSQRWDELGNLMVQFTDRSENQLCLSPTNEEAVVDYFKKIAKSYKQLPTCLYQINTKFRDEIRPRFGLMRAREFIMKDAYSFHLDKACLNNFYKNMYNAYEAIFKRMGLDFIAVQADAGAMAESGSQTHEFQVLSDNGEDELVVCRQENNAMNLEMAKTKREPVSFEFNSNNYHEVLTPNINTIEKLTKFFSIPSCFFLKTLVFKAKKADEDVIVLAVCLGDDEINPVKCANHLQLTQIQLASSECLKKENFVNGFVGPLGAKSNAYVIVDSHVNIDASYIIGANKKDTHLKDVIPKRDFSKFVQEDIRKALVTDVSLKGNKIEFCKGIEVGHIFQLGNKYTKSLEASVLNNQGKAFFPEMGCYGIGVGRAIAAVIEQSHDNKGMCWPVSISPFDVVINQAFLKDQSCVDASEVFYHELKANSIDVIIDDRNVSIGVKFKDADLIGFPYQVVFGKSFKNDGVIELIERKTGEKQLLTTSKALEFLIAKLSKKCV